ncbi:YbaB/EbfC family nucleoid-associated protein [Nocardia wallacei]|uniref:YbaB/EbfC family nucleoid-associated protein n=1 Tax=Nocardia wallacei TaxID=480035 RepID=UPI0024589BAE|nr:YbaB/EbfC family nucleoid-associated protein [Nocardia wallacei]
MDRWEREGLCAANHGMRNQIDHMLDALAEQQTHLTEAQEQLSATRCTGVSADSRVKVTVDAIGVVIDVELTPDAYGASPRQLAESVVEASQQAVRRARERTREIMAPIVAGIEAMPELADLTDDTPSLRAALGFLNRVQ